GLVGCERQSRLYCEQHPTDHVSCGSADAGGDAVSATCTDDQQCTAPTSRCAPGPQVCVECLGNGDCANGLVCADDHACHECATNVDCASDVCLPDGACAPAS